MSDHLAHLRPLCLIGSVFLPGQVDMKAVFGNTVGKTVMSVFVCRGLSKLCSSGNLEFIVVKLR